MTLYTALQARQTWERYTSEPEPPYQERVFSGDGDVPIYGIWAIPPQPRGTIVATYGIIGSLQSQWFLRILGRKAYAAGYAVVLFDWRAHGETAKLSPVLTSDGIHEGLDFVRIAEQAIDLGCPAPVWLMGYSLGGQLALWGGKVAADIPDIAGVAVICPSLESARSLAYLERHPIGKYLEREIAKNLKKLAWQLHSYHPKDFDPQAIERANTIWGFDRELVIPRLGFATVEDYYRATSPIYFLSDLKVPTFILYAADDPLFLPSLIPEIIQESENNSSVDLIITPHGGHVGFISSRACQREWGDTDRWWAWNRVLEWIDRGGVRN
jgi:uncharacterized protein